MLDMSDDTSLAGNVIREVFRKGPSENKKKIEQK